MVNLTGNFNIAKAHLVNNALHLVIGTRRKPQGNKPKSYLLRLNSDNSYSYISSLYPSKDAPNRFEIDYTGVKYVLTMSESKPIATIEKFQKETGNHAITHNPNVA